MNLSWLKNLKFLKSAKTVKTVTNVTKASKIGTTLKQLPVVRIIAGSAVGIAIIDTWNSSVNTISDVLGTSDDVSTVILGAVAAIAIAIVITSIIAIRRGH